MVAFQPSADTNPGLGCPGQLIDTKLVIIEPDPSARWRVARKKDRLRRHGCVTLHQRHRSHALPPCADAMQSLRLNYLRTTHDPLAMTMHDRDDSDTLRGNPKVTSMTMSWRS